MSTSSVAVLDNGGGYCKAGIGGDRDPIAVVPNCVGRSPAQASSGSKKKEWMVADQLLHPDNDPTSVTLRRPMDRGYLVNPDLQRDIWDRIFSSLLKIQPSSTSLLLVEPLFNLPSIQRFTDELVFEEFGFSSLCVADPPSLVHLYETSRCPKSLMAAAQCSLVVDCGFSFMHAAPVVQNFTLNHAVKRVGLGGKALTNYLKQLVSYRSVNLMDETVIMDHVKENLCFVSLDLQRDLQIARKSGKENVFKCTYVLPDGVTYTKGFVKDIEEAQRYLTLDDGISAVQSEVVEEDCESLSSDEETPEDRTRIDLTKNEELKLTNERFLVPEMLFHPSDLGINEAGLAECIVRAVQSCHPYLHPVLYESIILTGGSTLFPHFVERLERELRPLVPDDFRLKITHQEDPILGVWRGGSLLASSPDFEAMCVTKHDYEELGSTRCRRRFMH
ncbi:actin-related protein 6 [Amborella trichopoda]|uniref:Actin-related protein 6 n=1 Tax=Amborella trichopoda TaxID=13333 RepID=U5D1X1_AMBTC|nr:actin-related protein 6 [Amborella trichopoda]ERN14358.1 hypothetical protein AMTR_s00033p00218160 [Amborella trichopoda]|eukprot:XP_006852891.1 actin-related protein 6 [Amborella trichopoda]